MPGLVVPFIGSLHTARICVSCVFNVCVWPIYKMPSFACQDAWKRGRMKSISKASLGLLHRSVGYAAVDLALALSLHSLLRCDNSVHGVKLKHVPRCSKVVSLLPFKNGLFTTWRNGICQTLLLTHSFACDMLNENSCVPTALPLVPAEPANAVICNGMVQVSTLQILHDHEGTVRLQASPNELHNIAVMTALQNGNLLLEDV